ncbi:ABC transporter substrate-binding protein [Acetobacteraceae bacterium H6797]|nr:ABC transporter substrate-binding protein [Acetobacteraceae bacterium H6797]
MFRRSLFKAGFSAGAASLLAAPALAQDTRATTLRFVPSANLAVLDPIWTTATITGTHGNFVFDTLYAMDETMQPRPQMAEGHEVSADGLTWRFKLREGLKFHDGEPVRAVDCIASLQRWCAREPFGQLLMKAADSWRAIDDRSFEIKLTRPFLPMLEALGKGDTSMPFIMPERLAKTDPSKQVTEMVGSGPYRFIQSEFNSGAKVVYEKFDGYLPRAEAPSWAAGGKVAHFKRVEWIIIPDPATAAAALMNNEIDWWERPQVDLQPQLARSRDIAMPITDTSGRLAIMRFNSSQPPFDDVRLRRAVRLAVDQAEYMQASRGDAKDLWKLCRSQWPAGSTYHQDAEALMPASLDKARKALSDAGYAGQKAVIINPTDYPDIGPLGQVTFDLLKKIGFNVELAESDWGTVIQRRANRGPVEKGGWSVFHTTGTAAGLVNPAMSYTVRGNGQQNWAGWWESPKAEALVQDWLDAKDKAGQEKAAHALDTLVMEDAPTIPLGQFTGRTAHRKSITGIVPGPFPYPWGVKRA